MNSTDFRNFLVGAKYKAQRANGNNAAIEAIEYAISVWDIYEPDEFCSVDPGEEMEAKDCYNTMINFAGDIWFFLNRSEFHTIYPNFTLKDIGHELMLIENFKKHANDINDRQLDIMMVLSSLDHAIGNMDRVLEYKLLKEHYYESERLSIININFSVGKVIGRVILFEEYLVELKRMLLTSGPSIRQLALRAFYLQEASLMESFHADGKTKEQSVLFYLSEFGSIAWVSFQKHYNLISAGKKTKNGTEKAITFRRSGTFHNVEDLKIVCALLHNYKKALDLANIDLEEAIANC